MELSVAARLLEPGIDNAIPHQTWADLGAGTGLFTTALSILIPQVTIYAIDKNATGLNSIHVNKSAEIKKITTDFVHDDLDIMPCDGILMANSLHYVEDKVSCVKKIKKHLKKTGVMIIIEYEREKATSWVPFPVKFFALKQFMLEAGFTSVTRIGEEPSIFDRSVIYSARIQ